MNLSLIKKVSITPAGIIETKVSWYHSILQSIAIASIQCPTTFTSLTGGPGTVYFIQQAAQR